MTAQDELFDEYENQGVAGPPVISWASQRIGGTFTGVVLPIDPINRPDKGHKPSKDWQNGTDEDPGDKGFLVWPEQNNKEKLRRPITVSKYMSLGYDPDKMQFVSHAHVLLQTEYGAAEFMSEKAEKRYRIQEKDPGAEKLRRVIVSGGDLKPKINGALAKVGGKPMPGQTWTIKIADRVQNEKNGKTSVFEVTITRPTPETMAMVKAYVGSEKAKVNEATDAADTSDPYGGGSNGSNASVEPPF